LGFGNPLIGYPREVIINNLKAMVGVIYRPPHSDVSYWQKFENNIQPILDLNIPVILGHRGGSCQHVLGFGNPLIGYPRCQYPDLNVFLIQV
jgi:hypothetical protein